MAEDTRRNAGNLAWESKSVIPSHNAEKEVSAYNHVEYKKKEIPTRCIMRVLDKKDGTMKFSAAYDKEELAAIINDIAQKDASRIDWFPAVDMTFLEHGLDARDILRILREGRVLDYMLSNCRTQLKIEMTLEFSNSSAFVLAFWIDSQDRIVLADINAC
jgi:hypothetical protein